MKNRLLIIIKKQYCIDVIYADFFQCNNTQKRGCNILSVSVCVCVCFKPICYIFRLCSTLEVF